MTATVTTWHRVKVRWLDSWGLWLITCRADGCDWARKVPGFYAWRSAVDKALAHVDDTKEQT